MRVLPLDIGPLHFVGIGGIGMSGIAEVLLNQGYTVQGSDISDNANVKRLRDMGMTIHVGHAAENLGEAAVVVVSSAIKLDNPEIASARERKIPVVRRAEMLAELMRLKYSIAVGGTHGKTTTTSMVASMLDAAEMDPTVVNGGIINAYGSNARLGDGEWMVAEADESDGSFTKLPATVAIVTNMDPEHLDHYGDFETEKKAFQTFVENIPFYGFAVMCIDHPEVQSLIGRIQDRKIVTYGFNPQAEVRAVNIKMTPGGTLFDVVFTDRQKDSQRTVEGIRLPMLGKHNVQNALAAIAIAQQLDLSNDVIRKAMAGFEGVKRRFTNTGMANGITVIDDYAHHPVEIQAVLGAARQSYDGRVIAVFQPHRYSRVQDLFEEFSTCFNDADAVVVSHVYPAGEKPIEGIDQDHLIESIRAHGHRKVVPLESEDKLAEVVLEIGGPGDLVVCLGAGTVSAWAHALPGQIEELAE